MHFSAKSEDLDAIFGFNIAHIEGKLLKEARDLRPNATVWGLGQALHGHQTWVGLDPQTLNTPYAELEEVCHLLDPKPSEVVVDLGAGYGRLGLVLSKSYPEVHFIGFELVKERVDEGNRVFQALHLKHELKVQDITLDEFKIPEAKFYFLYDFGDVGAIRKVLNELSKIADHHAFKIVARGKGSRSLIDLEFPWLTVETAREHFSIYAL